jgi:hypothetical protein
VNSARQAAMQFVFFIFSSPQSSLANQIVSRHCIFVFNVFEDCGKVRQNPSLRKQEARDRMSALYQGKKTL